jgi:hypothetical protein
MPYKNREDKLARCKLYNKTWYEKNKLHRRAQIYEKRRRERDEWQEFKASIKCERCGAQHAAIIDFHHPNPSKDDTKVFKLVAQGNSNAPMKKLQGATPYVPTATAWNIGKIDKS